VFFYLFFPTGSVPARQLSSSSCSIPSTWCTSWRHFLPVHAAVPFSPGEWAFGGFPGSGEGHDSPFPEGPYRCPCLVQALLFFPSSVVIILACFGVVILRRSQAPQHNLTRLLQNLPPLPSPLEFVEQQFPLFFSPHFTLITPFPVAGLRHVFFVGGKQSPPFPFLFFSHPCAVWQTQVLAVLQIVLCLTWVRVFFPLLQDRG